MDFCQLDLSILLTLFKFVNKFLITFSICQAKAGQDIFICMFLKLGNIY